MVSKYPILLAKVVLDFFVLYNKVYYMVNLPIIC